jgi:hypothetical protein
MKLSRDKINHISSLIVRDFEKRDDLDYKEDLNDIRLEITRVMTEKLDFEDRAEQEARKTLASYSKKMHEGSPEWEILFQKHYVENLTKFGF